MGESRLSSAESRLATPQRPMLQVRPLGERGWHTTGDVCEAACSRFFQGLNDLGQGYWAQTPGTDSTRLTAPRANCKALP